MFICHSSFDKPFARRLAEELRNRGAEVWIDEEKMTVGDSLFESISFGIEQADYVVVLVTAASLQRPWVRKELAAAFSLEVERGGKCILPILLEGTELPALLKDKVYADFRHSWRDGIAALEAGLGLADSDFAYSFRTLKSEVAIEILDELGSLAHYKKTSDAMCLRDHVDITTDHFYVDGALTNIRVTPGSIDRTWPQAGYTFVQTRLPAGLRKNSPFHQVLEMDFTNTFTSGIEYWEARMDGLLDETAVVITFPKARAPRRWWAEERAGGGFYESRVPVALTDVAGHARLRMDMIKPPMSRCYVLRWEW